LFGFCTVNGGELRSDVIERLSPECGHNKDIQSNDFQISLTLSGEKILSISSGTGIHVLFLWLYPSLRIFLLAAIWILKVATAIVVKETSSFPVIKKDVKKVIWLLWIKKSYTARPFDRFIAAFLLFYTSCRANSDIKWHLDSFKSDAWI